MSSFNLATPASNRSAGPESRSLSVPRRSIDLGLPALTLPVIAIAALAVLIIAQAVHGFTDPDFWWHYKTGEYIISSHSIPRADFFSYPSAGRAWIAHEWLAESLIYGLMRLGGYGTALIAFAISPLIAVLALYRLQRVEGVAANVSLATTALAALMMAPFTTVRPQVLSWACFAVLTYALFAYRAGRIHRLWALPLLFALWANLHLSFAVGLGILALFIAAQAASQWLSSRTINIRHPLVILVASTLAACINPNGPRLLLVPFSYLPLQTTLISRLGLAEWQAPDFHNYLFMPLLAGLLLLLAAGVLGSVRDLWPAALTLCTAALALLAVRYIPIFAIAFAPAAGLALTRRFAWARVDRFTAAGGSRTALHWALMAAVLGCLAIAVRPSATTQLHREPPADSAFLPVDSVNFIQQHYPIARMLNQYEWGGYLIYRLWPQNRPFIDGRGEMYALPFLRDYVRVYSVQPGWQQVLSRYDVNLVIVRQDTSLAGALESDPEWQIAHRDNVSVVYTRTERSQP